MNRVFLDEIEPRDQTYRFIRDHPDGVEAKAFVEHLWAFFSRYADPNFSSTIADTFSAKFWEMYLAFGLVMQGAKLQPISSGGQGRGNRIGPDLLLSGLPHPVWVEDDHLVVKNWYKEHPFYVKENEPAFTLEDAIQKNNAQRRVTREMSDQWRKEGV